MHKLIVLCLMLMGCVQDSFDPTGTWQMVFTPQQGTCNQTQPTNVDLVVSRTQDNIVLTASDNLSASGGIALDSDSAMFIGEVVDSDVFNDGGSTIEVDSLTAIVDDSLRIHGFGTAEVAGVVTCSQAFGITGLLMR